MKYFMLLLLFFLSLNVKTQPLLNTRGFACQSTFKPALDIDDLKSWTEVTRLQMSEDGRYCGYVIDHRKGMDNILVLMSVENQWKIESTIKGNYSFSSKRSKAFWINSNDSLCIITLGGFDIRYVPDIISFWITDNLLIYQPKYSNGKMVVVDFKDRFYRKDWNGAVSIVMSNGVSQLILEKKEDKDKLFLKLKRRKTELWSGCNIGSIIKDNERGLAAFTCEKGSNTIFYYKLGNDTVTCLRVPSDSSFSLGGLSSFSNDGEYLFLNLIECIPALHGKRSILNVWSYTDSKLQPQQLMDEAARKYTGVIRLSDHHFFRLDSGNDWLFLPQIKDTVALIRRQIVTTPVDEINWNIHSWFSWYLISMKDNRRIKLDCIEKSRIVQLSPSGKYVVYFDSKEMNYFVYDIKRGYRRCLTKGINEKWLKDKDDDSYGQYIAAWGKDDGFVLLNGRRDIWQIDPSGLTPPINLTEGYGNRHNVVFFLALDEYARRPVSKHELLLLCAFNLDTKENGFYKTAVGGKGKLDSLSMGPYVYDIKDNPYIPSGTNRSPVKASKSEKFVVRRMSANEAPNFFFTKDFRNFKQLSNIQPQRSYNWYRAELHGWKSLDSTMLKGILYKPENFDSTKKYPVVFYYYERKSDALNVYMKPNILDNGCEINIPYYVSNGYLVFCPDIRYCVGDPMKGTYDAVVSAASYIGKLSFVDPRRLGVQGCSWGAVQTNYIITHTNLFAAACSASGIANWVSDYGSLAGTGESMQGMFEIGQFRMNGTLWEKRDTYIRNSPIFQVKEVTTPLLLMHTKEDMICSLSDIQAFFRLLRAAGKKSWFLLYDGNHGVYGRSGEDFGLRMKQFFDCYLRDYPAPEWIISPNPQ